MLYETRFHFRRQITWSHCTVLSAARPIREIPINMSARIHRAGTRPVRAAGARPRPALFRRHGQRHLALSRHVPRHGQHCAHHHGRGRYALAARGQARSGIRHRAAVSERRDAEPHGNIQGSLCNAGAFTVPCRKSVGRRIGLRGQCGFRRRSLFRKGRDPLLCRSPGGRRVRARAASHVLRRAVYPYKGRGQRLH